MFDYLLHEDGRIRCCCRGGVIHPSKKDREAGLFVQDPRYYDPLKFFYWKKGSKFLPFSEEKLLYDVKARTAARKAKTDRKAAKIEELDKAIDACASKTTKKALRLFFELLYGKDL